MEMKRMEALRMLGSGLRQAMLAASVITFTWASTVSAETDVAYDVDKLNKIQVLLDALYDKGQIPNYAVEVRRKGEQI